VLAGALTAATAVLLPYHGIGLPDAFWAASAGGSAVLAWWRFGEGRALAAQPAPPPLDPAARADRNQQRLENLVGKLPIGRAAIAEMRRTQHLSRLRGSAVAATGARLDKAAKTLAGFAGRLDPEMLAEAVLAERALRDLAERTAGVERALALPTTTPGGHQQLAAAHADLVEQLNGGVTAYEGLVSAAASVVAEDGRLGQPVAITRLVEAADRLRGVAEGLAEFSRREPKLPDP
jgi:signal transduction histidine kinase